MEKKKMPSLVTILILTLITVITWVGFDVYNLFNKITTPSVPPEISAPLTPTLDQTSIGQIESRLYFSDQNVPDNVVGGLPTAPANTNPATQTPLVNASESGKTK